MTRFMKSSFPIHGIVPPVPTPLKADGNIDSPAFHRIAEHLVEGGIHAAFVLGSTGECASLSFKRRIEALDSASTAFQGLVPLIVGVGDSSLDQSVALACHAAEKGASAIVLNAPSYYEISGKEMRAYLDRIVPRLPLPLLLYNMPWLTGHSFDDATILHAMEFPTLAGFKDSSGDLGYLSNLVSLASARPELTVLVGNDFLFLDSLKLGAHGAVAGGANLYPHLFRQLHDAFATGDTGKAAVLQQEISVRGARIFSATGNPSSVFAAIKGGLAALGLCEPHMAPPIEPCSPELIARFRSLLGPAPAAA